MNGSYAPISLVREGADGTRKRPSIQPVSLGPIPTHSCH